MPSKRVLCRVRVFCVGLGQGLGFGLHTWLLVVHVLRGTRVGVTVTVAAPTSATLTRAV